MKETVRLPSTTDKWNSIKDGFESICGLPDCYGAIDGSLIAIHRFNVFDGWYCRKSFTAFNMQAVVNHRMQFISFTIAMGSQNDKAIFNDSTFGKTVQNILPKHGYIIADAGYKLFTHVMTPYPIRITQSESEKKYNLFHSITRMVVEQTFGQFKNIFRY